MAGRIVAAAPNVNIALAAATRKVVLSIAAPVNQDLELVRWGVSVDGIVSDALPILVEIGKITGGVSSAQTMVMIRGSGTIRSVGAFNYSAAPTYGAVLEANRIHPQSGVGFDVFYPLGVEPIILAGEIIAISCTAAVAVNVIPKMWVRE